jgi:hypothetical protein
MGDVFMASIKIHAYGHDFLCEGDKVSTSPDESCKNPLHEAGREKADVQVLAAITMAI